MDRTKRAGAIIYNTTCEEIIVIMNRWSAYNLEFKWGCPKGHRKDGESILDCAIREVFEETGLLFKITSKTPYICLSDTIYYMFRVPNVIKLQTHDDKEICEICWKSFDELAHLNKNRALRLICKICPHQKNILPIENPIENPIEPVTVECIA